jgi:hypothetical protein
MKYLKKFEENENEPQVGDYVICKEMKYPDDDFVYFLNTHIGRIKNYVNMNDTLYPYEIEFEEKLPRSSLKSRNFIRNEIIYWSKNKEDVIDYIEMMNNINKYNL